MRNSLLKCGQVIELKSNQQYIAITWSRTPSRDPDKPSPDRDGVARSPCTPQLYAKWWQFCSSPRIDLAKKNRMEERSVKWVVKIHLKRNLKMNQSDNFKKMPKRNHNCSNYVGIMVLRIACSHICTTRSCKTTQPRNALCNFCRVKSIFRKRVTSRPQHLHLTWTFLRAIVSALICFFRASSVSLATCQ